MCVNYMAVRRNAATIGGGIPLPRGMRKRATKAITIKDSKEFIKSELTELFERGMHLVRRVRRWDNRKRFTTR